MTDTAPVSSRPGRGPWYCGACNGPLWRGGDCRVCWLVGLTSFDVRALDEEDRDYTAEGEALSSVERWVIKDELESDPTIRDQCNDTNDTRATSWWLPPGAVRRAGLWDRHRVRATDDRSYAVWLSVYAIPPRDLDLIRAALTSVETTATQGAL